MWVAIGTDFESTIFWFSGKDRKEISNFSLILVSQLYLLPFVKVGLVGTL